MRYIRTAGWDDGTADLTQCLVRQLARGRRVLWLVSGGSNVPVSVQIMDNVPQKLQANLSIMLADERYGRPGHEDSNWAQLLAAGFQAGLATMLPVLREEASFEQTIANYREMAEQAFRDNDLIIAQLGIGDDGHIAGILPGSPAAKETEVLVTGYKSKPFDRLTLTFAGLRHIDTAYAFAFGNTKQQALATLRGRSVPPREQPAQILKQLPHAYVYSDQFKEPAS